MLIPVDKIIPNPEQPRKEFDKTALEELAASIRQHGVLQPILVEPCGERYQLQAGERRLRAAKMAGLKEIPVVVRPPLNGTGPRERLILAIVENVQRSDMNPIEEARGYERLAQEHNLSQVEIAHEIGIPVSRVTIKMKALKLEKETQELIRKGTLTHDPRVVDALLDLRKDDQVKVAQGLAARRVGPKVALEAICRFQEHLGSDKIGSADIPARRLAAAKVGQPNQALWSAMQQLGKIPPWILVEISARDTCEKCGLRDQASATTCKGCPLVDFLTQITGAVNNGKH